MVLLLVVMFISVFFRFGANCVCDPLKDSVSEASEASSPRLPIFKTPTPLRNLPQHPESEQTSTVDRIKVEISGEKIRVRLDKFNFYVFINGEMQKAKCTFVGKCEIGLKLDKQNWKLPILPCSAIPHKEEDQNERRFARYKTIFSLRRKGLDVYIAFAVFDGKKILRIDKQYPFYLDVYDMDKDTHSYYDWRVVFHDVLGRILSEKAVKSGRVVRSSSIVTQQPEEEGPKNQLTFYFERGILYAYEHKPIMMKHSLSQSEILPPGLVKR